MHICFVVVLLSTFGFESLHSRPLISVFINGTRDIYEKMCSTHASFNINETIDINKVSMPRDILGEWIYPMITDPFYRNYSSRENITLYYYQTELWEDLMRGVALDMVDRTSTCEGIAKYQSHPLSRVFYSFYRVARLEEQYDALYRWYRSDDIGFQMLLSLGLNVHHVHFCSFLSELDQSGVLWAAVNSVPSYVPNALYCGSIRSERGSRWFDHPSHNITWKKRDSKEPTALPDLRP
jgi:hypothetical protein